MNNDVARCGGSRRRPGGFSLLEMLVAISILGLTLGVLYQAVSGATRNVRTDERYAFGVELARSLLADHGNVRGSGISRRGETAGGFQWQVSSNPLSGPDSGPGSVLGQLQAIEVSVNWQDGLKQRQVVLHSVVEGTLR